MTQPTLFPPPQLPDVTRRKHGGNSRSEAANESVSEHKATVAERIHKFVAAVGMYGATVPEIAAVMQHPTKKRHYFPNEISGRRTELVMDGRLFVSGRVRDGAEVLVASKQWVNGSQEQ